MSRLRRSLIARQRDRLWRLVLGAHHACRVGSFTAPWVCIECRTPYPCETVREAAAFDNGESLREFLAQTEVVTQ